MSIDLYYLNASPPCRAVLMIAKTLEIEENVDIFYFFKHKHLSREFMLLNPGQTVPTIIDQGFVLWEGRAIMQYLCNKYAPDSSLYPADPAKRAAVDKWLYIDMTYFKTILDVLAKKPTEQQIKNYYQNLKLIDTLIGTNKYVAGNELTIADLSVLSTTTLLIIDDYHDLEKYPNLKIWFENMRKSLPYFDEVNNKVDEEVKELAQFFENFDENNNYVDIPYVKRERFPSFISI